MEKSPITHGTMILCNCSSKKKKSGAMELMVKEINCSDINF